MSLLACLNLNHRLRIMKRHFFLLLAVSAAVTAASSNDSCIAGCKCQDQEDISSGRKLLKFYDCALTITDQTFVDNATNIKTLYFENVIIIKIEKDALNALTNLENVIVKNSSINSIDSSAFDLPELGTVSFTGTTFREVPNLKSDYLETLIFTDCKLSELPNLDQLTSLNILQLENNYIREIGEMAFSKLETLEELILSNNSISRLPPNVFDNNIALNTLLLDNNPLESFQLSNLSNLEYLSLKSCKLTKFDENSSKNLELVNHLDLSNNKISVLPIDAFSGMSDLNYIDLSNNELVEISDNIFEDNSKLEKIVLDGNKLERLPKFQCDDEAFQIYYFSCNNCGLKSLNDAFNNMQGIVTLILSNNQISDIEGAFDQIHGLKELDLSNNTITKIGINAFAKNTALETLNLSGNPLKPLDPVVFANIESLKKLDISRAGLEQIWTNHNSILPSVERLLLRKNNLSTITLEDVKVTPRLKLIDIEENPLKCTEDLHDVVLWLVTRSVYPIQGADKLKTHEALTIPEAVSFEDVDQETYWKTLAYEICFDDTIFDDDEEDIDYSEDNDDKSGNSYVIPPYKTETSSSKYDDFYDDEYDYSYEDEEKDDDSKLAKEDAFDNTILSEESVIDHRNINLARASYILSVTSVFVLTALVVLTVAVAVTLFVLRKNGAFNMHNENLPRLKIPLWHSTPTQKKHSGSVYKPLSEDLSGPKTPIINRYEFKSNPAVHNSIP